MDLNKVGENYVQRMVSGAEGKARVLLLDKETTGMISLVSTQSELLKNDVFLVDHLANPARQKMRHLDCLCFVRPSSESIQLLVEELRNPKYAKYTLIFSNVVKKSHLERIAEADDHEVVVKVLEMFCDYYTVNKDLFSAGEKESIYGPESNTWNPKSLDRAADSVLSVLLSLKLKPLIRYEANSPMSKRLAADISRQIEQQATLFDFPPRDTPPILLIVDRRNDPVTPLLSHWTYQAMVDEIIGIENNRVSLDDAPELSDELREIVLSQSQDPFFAETMYLNFGDLGERIRDYVSQYQSKTQSSKQISTVADMKRFVEEYPEFRRLSGNVSKHVSLVSELSRQVDARHLLEVSETEQSLACSDSHAKDLKQLQTYLASPAIEATAKYRLVALYSLRYQHRDAAPLAGLLGQIQPADSELHAGVEKLVRTYAGQRQRQEDIFTGGSLLQRAQFSLKNLSLQGVDNVYTQHKPLLEQTLQQLQKGRLRKNKYPFYDAGDGSLPQWAITGEETEHPQDVIVFFVGGVTYEEARIVAEANNGTGRMRVVVGGTRMVNHDLLREVAELQW